MFFSCFRIPDDRPGDEPILLDQRRYLRVVDSGAAEIEDGLRQIDRQSVNHQTGRRNRTPHSPIHSVGALGFA